MTYTDYLANTFEAISDVDRAIALPVSVLHGLAVKHR